MLTVAFIVPPLVAVVLWDAPWLLRSLESCSRRDCSRAVAASPAIYMCMYAVRATLNGGARVSGTTTQEMVLDISEHSPRPGRTAVGV